MQALDRAFQEVSADREAGQSALASIGKGTVAERTLGDRVKAERQARDWSQADLAERVVKAGAHSMSQPGILKIESGATKRPTCVHELAKVFGVSVRWLKTGKGRKAAA